MTIVAVILAGLAEIEKIAKSDVIEDAELALSAIRGIFAALDTAAAGAITPTDAKAKIDELVAALKSNDAAADAALDAKFPTGESP